MQRWEYRVVSLGDRQYTAALNEYGRDGWELISVVSEAITPAMRSGQRGYRFRARSAGSGRPRTN